MSFEISLMMMFTSSFVELINQFLVPFFRTSLPNMSANTYFQFLLVLRGGQEWPEPPLQSTRTWPIFNLLLNYVLI